MYRKCIGLAVASAVIALAGLIRAAPVAADALYPAGNAGTWDFNNVCDGTSWSRTYSLWYILNDAQDYAFDIPDPDLGAGGHVTVELAPVVVGSLSGSVSLTGTTTISADIPAENPHPGDTMWQDTLSDDEFTLAFEPGRVTSGDVDVPAEWADEYVGFAALEAVITDGEGAESTIVMLAQPFSDCDAPEPTETPAATDAPAEAPSAAASPSVTAPPTDTASDHGSGALPPGHEAVWLLVVIASGCLGGEQLRRRAR